MVHPYYQITSWPIMSYNYYERNGINFKIQATVFGNKNVGIEFC